MQNQQNISWTKVWVSEDGMEAQLIKNLLEIENIPYQLKNENTNSLFPDTGIVTVDIFVPQDKAEEVKKMIEENFT